MDRWAGVLKVSLTPNKGGPFVKVAASLQRSPSFKTLAVPSVNAIFFNGDRVEGTGNPIIERLSDSRYIADLLVSKLGGGAVNSWVVDAPTFNGPFAVYKGFVPSVNSRGDPKHYDPDGFPASSSIVSIMSDCTEQVKGVISSTLTKPTAANTHFATSSPLPKTIIMGFSKGGIVVNQIIAELAHMKSNLNPSPDPSCSLHSPIFPASEYGLLSSISEFHYVDVGLNCAGAYLTDYAMIKKLARCLSSIDSSLLFAFHGTPRQWCNLGRPWIREEKDTMRQLLEGEARGCEGRLQITERFYFEGKPPSLLMHFEIIEALVVS